MKFFNAIKNWISGLFKRNINEDYKLETEFNKDIFSFGDGMYRAYDEIDASVCDLPLRNLSYGIRDFKASIADERYNHRIEDIGHNIYLNKENYKKYEFNKLTEVDVNFTIISKCLDNKIWKFEIKTYFVYNCFTNAYDADILRYATILANGFVSDMNLNSVTSKQYHIEIPISTDVDKLAANYFTGYTKTYGDMEYLKQYGINDLVDTKNPDDYFTDEADTVIPLDELLRNETIRVSDVTGNGKIARRELINDDNESLDEIVNTSFHKSFLRSTPKFDKKG